MQGSLRGESGGSVASCRSAASIRFNGDGAWTLLLESVFSSAHPVELAFCFRQFFQVSPLSSRKPRVRGFQSVYRSVGAAVRIVVRVIGIVRAIEAVAVQAAAAPSAKVLVADVRHSACAKAADMACANAANATSAKATNVGCAEAAHATAEATHVAAAKATAAMASATATATAAATGLGTSSQQAAGEHCARQNHHHSSSHDILLWNGRTIRHRSSQTPACPRKANANVVMD